MEPGQDQAVPRRAVNARRLIDHLLARDQSMRRQPVSLSRISYDQRGWRVRRDPFQVPANQSINRNLQ
jgi:hypothetical protein